MSWVFGAYGNHLFTEYCSNPLQQCFCVFETCTARWRKMACFFLSHERPSKGLARCRQLDLCTVLQPTARLTNSLSRSWLCIKHNTLRGRTSPIVWARVWTRALCRHIVPLFLSSHSALSSSRSKWLHQKKTSGPFTSYLWTIFVVELIKELGSDKEATNWWLYPAKRFASVVIPQTCKKWKVI